MAILEEISLFLQQGKKVKVEELVAAALEEGISPKEIMEKGLLAGMDIIGSKFKNNEIYVPEVLIAARAMNAGMAILKPHLVSEGVEAKGTAVIGTVRGDLHDIGKNLVKMMLEGKGLKTIDLGTDVTPEKFVAEAKANNAQIICCSALLTTTMGEMKNVVDEVKREGLSGKVKVMIGGAPVTEEYRRSIDADYYTTDAASAAEVAIQICENA